MKLAIFPRCYAQCSRKPTECLLRFHHRGHGLAGRSSLAKHGQSVAATVTIAQLIIQKMSGWFLIPDGEDLLVDFERSR